MFLSPRKQPILKRTGGGKYLVTTICGKKSPRKENESWSTLEDAVCPVGLERHCLLRAPSANPKFEFRQAFLISGPIKCKNRKKAH